MPISMYSASVPIFTTGLRNLSHILDKAKANAEKRNFGTAVLLGSRLAPDMLPLSKQIQIACDAAKLCVARLAGDANAPKFEDTETTLEELQQRIHNVLAYIASVQPGQIDGSEDLELVIPAGGGKTRAFTGEAYLKHWAIPNMYFHITTAYAILRHNGVDIGKVDYLAGAAAA